MIKGKGIYLALSVLALALTGLGIIGYVDLNRKYAQLDKKFTATADSLKDYKATLQNQGLYGPLRADLDKTKKGLDQLRGYTEGLFGGSEKVHQELGEEIVDVQERLGKLELKANSSKR